MSIHGYILIDNISFPYKAPGMAAQDLFPVPLPQRERSARLELGVRSQVTVLSAGPADGTELQMMTACFMKWKV